MLNESEPNSLPPIQSDEFLPPISLWTTLGGLFLVGTCCIAVAVAAFTRYNVTVQASATLRPVGELRLVQSVTQGIVTGMAIKENQIVQKGDIIATLDDSRLQTQKSQLQSNLKQNQQQLRQIDAQILALDGQIAAERDHIGHTVASAQAELEETQRDYQDRRLTTQSQVQEAEANLKQAQEEFQKTQFQLKSAQANLKAIEAALNAAIARRDRYKPIAEQGALSQDQYQEAELAVTQQKQAQEAQKATVGAQQQEIERLSSAVDAAGARRQVALAALNPSKAKVAISRKKILQERATGAVTLSRLSQEREQLLQRRLELPNQLNRDQDELQQIETELKGTVIRASASGTIQQLNLRNTEQVVNTGDVIAQIAPSEAPLVIKALVPSGEIAKVETGQRAQMRVSACPYPDYGTLNGTVSAISPDAIVPQNNGVNEARSSSPNAASATYSVTIQPERLQLNSRRQSCTIQLGMEGRADIITKEESVLTFIFRKARLLTNF
ncbi:HlyD family efflux transporter periplasmic adaptor subunit [Microcoleus vaginatus]|uniref:HlyD family efflux transporter periplasmic adaptor subunit n=1 Tax=Microcoleus vaginatus TaxID=119532 RepID=UPI00020D1AED|nr:secretion protein HlyD family protein [Microcoleus vaginatus FGP-2]